MASGQRAKSEPSLEGATNWACSIRPIRSASVPKNRSRDGSMWRGTVVSSPADWLRQATLAGSYTPPKKEVAARGCHCNEVPAGLLGSPLPRRILGRAADGAAVRLGSRGRRPPSRAWEGCVVSDCPPDSLLEPGAPRQASVVPADGPPPGSRSAYAQDAQASELDLSAGRDWPQVSPSQRPRDPAR